MKLTARQDIAESVEEAYRMVLRFERFERIAAERGIDVRRRCAGDASGLGASWDIRADLLGKRAEMTLSVARAVPPRQLSLAMTAPGLAGTIDCTFEAVDAATSRMTLAVEIAARSLSTRLLLKPLQLAEAQVNDRFRNRVAAIVRQIEEDEARHASRDGGGSSD